MLLLLGGAASAQAPATLITQLGDDDPRVREAAHERLTALGPDAIGPLEAARTSPDLEVRLRAVQILRAIRAVDLRRALARSPTDDPLSGPVRAAVTRGLLALASRQREDGRWRDADGAHPIALTALAGLALRSSGSTPTRGPLARPLARLLGALLAAPRDEGLLAARGEHRPMFAHGLSMQLLADVLVHAAGPTRARIEATLGRAVRLAQAAQGPTGGWSYSPRPRGDEAAVSIVTLTGLLAARRAGVPVAPATLGRGLDYLARLQHADGGIAYSLHSRGASRPALSWGALAVLLLAADTRAEGTGARPAVREALVRHCVELRRPIDRMGHFSFTHLHHGLALQWLGQPTWPAHQSAIARLLIDRQRDDGTWQHAQTHPVDYDTAVALIVLQRPLARLLVHPRPAEGRPGPGGNR